MPASLLTLAAGAVFGLGLGVVMVSLGSMIAATLAFLIARYLARGVVEAKTRNSGRLGALDQAVSEGGWKIVAMLRLSPVVPFTLQNYLLGVSGVKLVPYMLASWVAMLPATALYVYLGAVAGQAASGKLGAGQWAVLGVGLAATVLLTLYLARLAKTKLEERTDARSAAAPPHLERENPMNDSHPATATGRWKLPFAAALLAAIACVGVLLRGPLMAMFGPPVVTMQESYLDNPAQPVFDHAVLDGLLKTYVDADGLVDYPGLASEQAVLDGYLQALAVADFAALGRDEKLAMLINAYNAFTLKLMIEHPGVDSIRSIPAGDRWKAKRWTLAGAVYSLEEIEHSQVRPNFIEPRAHWALVCAAISCPPLRNEAYTGRTLEQQLDAQAKTVFTRGTRWYAVSGDPPTLEATAIMQWYAGDFEQVAGSLANYIAQYDPEVKQHVDAGHTPEVDSLPYDWALNSQDNAAKLNASGATNGTPSELHP